MYCVALLRERTQSNVCGVMLESHLVDGNQKISDDMVYGQSVTDGCLGWEKTEQVLLRLPTHYAATPFNVVLNQRSAKRPFNERSFFCDLVQ